MSFLRRIFGGQPAAPRQSAQEDGSVLWLYVQCDGCGERLRIRVSKAHDLSLAEDTSDEMEDDEAAPSEGYRLRKEILGNDCARLMEVRASFDMQRRLVEVTARGCRLLTPEEYAAATS